MSDDITAEYCVQELLPSTTLRAVARVTVGAKTDLGRVREHNEDKFEFFVPTDDATLAARGQTFVVCDGMGGHAAGQLASEMAAKTFLDVYYSHPAQDAQSAASAAITGANHMVLATGRAIPERRGMGTTLSALHLIQDQALVSHIGDSRVYRLRDEKLEQITFDHSFVEEMVRYGVMTLEQALQQHQKNVLTRCIGMEEGFAPEYFTLDLVEGDVFFLCSDGVVNHVTDDQIFEILRSNGPSSACWKLIGKALLDGGFDNATALVVRVDKIDRFEVD